MAGSNAYPGSAGAVRLMDRIHARWAARGPAARGFSAEPLPRTIGFVARGRQILAGNLMHAGHLVEAPGQQPWDLRGIEPAFRDGLHGFEWLDDLAAVGDVRARMTAQDWVAGWIARYGRGHGPGWTPALAGARLQRWLHHALMILRAADKPFQDRFFAALAMHVRFLARRGHRAPDGVARVEALVALLSGATTLDGCGAYAAPAHRALAMAVVRAATAEGEVADRNPETALTLLMRLVWALEALDHANMTPDPAIVKAAEALGQTLRALRHTDGSLARFHGGGRGMEGRLDAALAALPIRRRDRKPVPPKTGAMGYARLAQGRTSLIMDAAPPPKRANSAGAHASTLAFELTVGRRPLIVNCGAGGAFGPEWRRAGRATPSHSTLSLDGASSAILAPQRDGSEWLTDTPTRVPSGQARRDDALTIEGGHDGYVAAYGLTHARTLALSRDGRHLTGEDYLVALDDAAKAQFDLAFDATKLAGVPYKVHFHVHPDVDITLDMNATAASLALRSGELWVLRFDGDARLDIAPSVYLQSGRLQPRAAQQLVLSGHVTDYTTRLRWSLANAQDTGPVVRDLVEDALEEQ